MKILTINSSLSGTKTQKAMNALVFGAEVDHEHLNLKDLEMSFADGRDYREYDNDNKTIVQKIIDADALIIGTPIFQASIPGVLKNLFDLLPINAIQSKPVGVIVTAGSPRHYLVAQQHLLPVLSYLKTDVINKYVFLDLSDFTNDFVNDDLALRIETLSKEVETRVKYNEDLNKKKYDFL